MILTRITRALVILASFAAPLAAVAEREMFAGAVNVGTLLVTVTVNLSPESASCSAAVVRLADVAPGTAFPFSVHW